VDQGPDAIGGLLNIPDDAAAAGAPPHWLAYIAVPDVAATVTQASGLGAEILVGATEIPGAGSFVVLRDPQGAVFALFRDAKDTPASSSGEASEQEFSWHELLTTDHVAAFDFYAALFAWVKIEAMDMGEMGIYQIYGQEGGVAMGGMYNKPAELPASPHWLYYIKVKDIEAAVLRVKELGGQVHSGPGEVPGGSQVAQCCDPQGVVFALHFEAK